MANAKELFVKSLIGNIHSFNPHKNLSDSNTSISAVRTMLTDAIKYAITHRANQHACTILAKNIKRYNKLYPGHELDRNNEITNRLLIYLTLIDIGINPDKAISPFNELVDIGIKHNRGKILDLVSHHFDVIGYVNDEYLYQIYPKILPHTKGMKILKTLEHSVRKKSESKN